MIGRFSEEMGVAFNNPTMKREDAVILPSPLLNSKKKLQGTRMCYAPTQREGYLFND